MGRQGEGKREARRGTKREIGGEGGRQRDTETE